MHHRLYTDLPWARLKKGGLPVAEADLTEGG